MKLSEVIELALNNVNASYAHGGHTTGMCRTVMLLSKENKIEFMDYIKFSNFMSDYFDSRLVRHSAFLIEYIKQDNPHATNDQLYDLWYKWYEDAIERLRVIEAKE